jgi:hypothetical protein
MINRATLFNGASALALLAGASFYIHPAVALTITFDDLTDTSLGFGGTTIANGYQGLNWTNWNVLNTAYFAANFGPNGAQPGTVSPPNVAFNPNGGEAIFSSTTPFTLNTADLTAVWNDGLQVTVNGLLNGVQVDTTTLSPSATAAMLETFNWAGINEVDLLASGGTQHVGYSGAGTQVALDNLTITSSQVTTPEPSSLAIVGAGLAGLGLACRRRKAV